MKKVFSLSRTTSFKAPLHYFILLLFGFLFAIIDVNDAVKYTSLKTTKFLNRINTNSDLIPHCCWLFNHNFKLKHSNTHKEVYYNKLLTRPLHRIALSDTKRKAFADDELNQIQNNFTANFFKSSNVTNEKINLLPKIEYGSLGEKDQKSNVTKKLLPSTISLYNPNLNIEVHIVGCVHQTEASSKDVEYILSRTVPSTILLELCQQRFNLIMKGVVTRYKQKLNNSNANTFSKESDETNFTFEEGFADLRKNVAKSVDKNGFFLTMIALLTSLPQQFNFLQGKEPSCEFKTAIDYAKDKNYEAKKEIGAKSQKVTLVVADQDIDKTLTNFKEGILSKLFPFQKRKDSFSNSSLVSEIPAIPGSIIETRSSTPGNIKSLLLDTLEEMVAVPNAFTGVFSFNPSNAKINIFSVLFTDIRFVKELFQIVLPFLIFCSALNFSLETVLLQLESVWETLSLASSTSLSPSYNLDQIAFLEIFSLNNIGYFCSNYLVLIIAASLNKNILMDRDEYLFQSIMQSINSSSKKIKEQNDSIMDQQREYIVTNYMDFQFETINDEVSMTIKNSDKVPTESYLQNMKNSISNYFPSMTNNSASSPAKNNEERKVMVAVVGMLHCNGISKRLIGEGFLPFSVNND